MSYGAFSFAGVDQLSPACALVPEIVALGVSDWLNRVSNAVGFDLWWSWSRVELHRERSLIVLVAA